MPTFSMVFNAVGNKRALSAFYGGNMTFVALNYASFFEAHVTFKYVSGPSITDVKGVLIEIYPEMTMGSANLPEALISSRLIVPPGQTRSVTLFVPTGVWNCRVWQQDTNNLGSLEVTDATVRYQ